MNNAINKPVTFELNDTLEGVDTEAGLEPEVTQEQFVDEEEQLRIEFQQAVEKSAEDRANTPFQAAAMTHSRLCPAVMEEIDNLTSSSLKRILKYLIAYPFYVKGLDIKDPHVMKVAEAVDKLTHTKFTMAMCQAIEKEARVTAAIKEQEDLIQPLPDDLPKAKEE